LNLLLTLERGRNSEKDRNTEELKKKLIEREQLIVDMRLNKETEVRSRIDDKEKEWLKDRDWHERTISRLKEEQEKLIKLGREKKEKRRKKKEVWVKEIVEERMKKDDRIESLLKSSNEDKKNLKEKVEIIEKLQRGISETNKKLGEQELQISSLQRSINEYQKKIADIDGWEVMQQSVMDDCTHKLAEKDEKNKNVAADNERE